MQREVKNFLEHINLDKPLFSHFENASVKSARFNRTLNQLQVTLILDSVLDIKVYALLKSAISKLEDNVALDIEIINKDSLNEIALNAYYYYFLETHFAKSVIYDMLVKIKLYFKDETIVFKLDSQLLAGSLIEIKPELAHYFKKAGFNYELAHVVEVVEDRKLEEELEHERLLAIKEAERLKQAQIRIIQANEKNDDFYKQRASERKEITLKDLNNDDRNVTFVARIFNIKAFETKAKRQKIYNVFLTDDSGSVSMTLRESARFKKEFLETLSVGMYLRLLGDMEFSHYSSDYLFNPRSIEIVDFKKERYDDELNKRVELHLHTNMSTMDGVAKIGEYIDQAVNFGHKAIAITDHGGVQGFIQAQSESKGKPIKMIYGMEGYVVDEKYEIAYNPSPIHLNKATYVILDLETTGLSARHDKIIEFGAVKIKEGLVLDSYQTFINPKISIPKKIKDITNISDDIVGSAPTLKMVIPKILNFLGDAILVAHNATFDISFLNEALKNLGFPILTNPYIDTMNLAKCIQPNAKSYALGAVARSFDLGYDEGIAHRADYDARILADVFLNLTGRLDEYKKIFRHQDLNLLNRNDSYKTMRPYHMNFLVKNEIGLKNLYKLVTISHTEYITHLPLIPKNIISEYRDGLLIGSSCFNSEIFDIALTKGKEALEEAMKFYDYIEVQPLENYSWLIDTGRVNDEEQLILILKDIVEAAQNQKIMLVATGDAHYLNPEDKVYRDVYIYAQAIGARRHPLYDFRKRVKDNPNQHFRTTKEMLNSYPYLDKELVYEMVVTNTNLIANQIEEVYPVKDKLFPPKLDDIDAEKEIEELSYSNLVKIYGEKPPFIIKERYERELKAIKDNNFSVIYYLAHKLVKNSKDDGYLVGSRGSVGSSFLAFLCEITEVNPLIPHYVCPYCKNSDFDVPKDTRSGYDLEDKPCQSCGTLMRGNGHNIPFETFLGIAGNKVPDIDLNFSRESQAKAHEYTKVLLGEKNVFRAGTISTVADKTAYGYVRNFLEENGIDDVRNAEIERLAFYSKDVKRTTGQHPGGIIVIPNDKDVHDFTPIQYPADEVDSNWKTTHFPYQAIQEEVLKLDLLGHVDPSALRMLYDLTNVDPEEIPMNDEKVLSLFTSTNALGVTPEQILDTNGTAGVPEFGTVIAKGIIEDAKPTKFSELVQVSGISHGTGVWRGNAQDLVVSGTCRLMDAIGCRDDIMTFLVSKGMEHTLAFSIMESVRKGRGVSKTQEAAMLALDLPPWYIDSAKKIEYLFPKAHAAAYVSMALRIAWYKVYRPLAYYASYFTHRCDSYEINTMIEGYDSIKSRFIDIRDRMQNRNSEVSNKEKELYDVLQLALEMTARGITFANVSLEKSHSREFLMDEENNQLIPPFMSIDGLGESAASSIVEARNKRPFISKEDLMSRTTINQTNLKVLESLKALDHLQDENQLSLDLF